jgi:hypothetical protein
MKLRSPLLALGLFLLAALVAACGGSGGGGGGVPTIAPSASATPTATTTPGTGPTASATISYPAGGGAVAMPPVSNFSGTINLTAATSGGGAQTSIATQAYSPAGLPVIQVKRRATSQSNDPLLYISFTATTALTLSGYPGFAITLPETVSTDGSFSLVVYDPTHASQGWQLIGGPVIASGQVVTFSPGSTPVTFAANQTYVFAIFLTPNGPSPSPTSSPTGGATATPLPAAVPQLNEVSYQLATGEQPQSIVAGPDGNLWFTQCPSSGNGAVVMMTPSGVQTTYTLSGAPTRCPSSIVTLGSNLWFTESVAQMGEITTTGTITEYALPAIGRTLAVGSDNNLWWCSSGATIYGFSPTTQMTVGMVTLTNGYTLASSVVSNSVTGEILVNAVTSNESAGTAIFSFQPATPATLTMRYNSTSNTGYTVGPGPLVTGTDGNIYGWTFTNNNPGPQELLVLNATTYAASYVTPPQMFIFGNSTVTGSYSPLMVFLAGNLYMPNGGPRDGVSGIAELSTAGVLLGQADNDANNLHADWVSGAAGPDGNAWFAVQDLVASQGWIERIVPASSSGGSTRVRH